MNWITPILRIALALTIGPTETTVVPGGDLFRPDLPDHVFTTDVTAGVLLFDHLGIEGQTTIYTEPPWSSGGNRFYPYQAGFAVRAYLTFGPIEAGVEHNSAHPIMPAAAIWGETTGGGNTVYLVFEPEFD